MTAIFVFPLFSQVAYSITSPVVSEEYDKLFRATEEFKKFQGDLVSEIPIANEPTTDIDGNQTGWYIQYEVMVANVDSLKESSESLEPKPVEKVSSLLTYIYTDENDEFDIVLTDYSRIATDQKVYIIDVKTNEVLYDIEIDENLMDLAQEIDHQKQVTSNDEEFRTRSSNCRWWVCTRTQSGGGNWSNGCLVAGSVICAATISRVVSVACAGLNAIGCYVPNYTVCVAGYWETRFCPIRP